MKDDFKERIESLDEFCKDAIAVVERSMGRVEVLAKDNVNQKENDLKNMFDYEIGQVRDLVAAVKDDIEAERIKSLDKNHKQISDFKDASINYFLKYDERILTVEAQSESMMKKYEHWSKVLIEPSSMNHARLHSLETRISQEENSRLAEVNIIKDYFRKLIYSIE